MTEKNGCATLTIKWTRTALVLPASVRGELSSRVNMLHRYFPEMYLRLKVGITHSRSYEAMAFSFDRGFARLVVRVRRIGTGAWKYPGYGTLAHELMHLAQFNSRGIPGGERAIDIYTLARLPPKLSDDSPHYLFVPKGPRWKWTHEHARIAHELALDALERRSCGLRKYARWWEDEFERKVGVPSDQGSIF
jgi:hypothetical protein